ncbi:MAG: hypothetical protein AAFX92_04895 [Pseudomonadota bacterium]
MNDRFRSVIALVVSAALLCLAATTAVAQQNLPNLEGTWSVTDGRGLFWDGSTNHMVDDFRSFQIVIVDQADGVFGASNTAEHEESATPGYHGDEEIGTGAYPMVGVIGWDGTTVILADVEDTSVATCELTETDTMRCVGWEAGERAVVFRFILTRDGG